MPWFLCPKSVNKDLSLTSGPCTALQTHTECSGQRTRRGRGWSFKHFFLGACFPAHQAVSPWAGAGSGTFTSSHRVPALPSPSESHPTTPPLPLNAALPSPAAATCQCLHTRPPAPQRRSAASIRHRLSAERPLPAGGAPWRSGEGAGGRRVPALGACCRAGREARPLGCEAVRTAPLPVETVRESKTVVSAVPKRRL